MPISRADTLNQMVPPQRRAWMWRSTREVVRRSAFSWPTSATPAQLAMAACLRAATAQVDNSRSIGKALPARVSLCLIPRSISRTFIRKGRRSTMSGEIRYSLPCGNGRWITNNINGPIFNSHLGSTIKIASYFLRAFEWSDFFNRLKNIKE
jgi:hypothetical protein